MKYLQILTLISNPIKKMNSRIPQSILWLGTGFLMLGLVIGCGGGVYYHRLDSSPSYSRNMTHTLMSEEPTQDQYAVINENEYQDPKVSPLSTFSIDVDTASYSNLRRFLKSGQRPPIDAIRIEEMVNYFTYDYQAPQSTNEHPFSVYTELAQAPWNPQHQLLHIGLQGKKIPQTDLPPNNLVFLLDVSGSMHDRLPLLKNALRLLSGTLRAQDKVSIVVYAGAAGLVLPPTSGDQKSKIIDSFQSLEAGGSTAGGAGIKLAYKIAREHFMKEGNNRIILATDGDFNVGISSKGALVRLIEEERKSGVYLTVLGFGRGNYNEATMSELAEKGNGNFAYIDSILEAQKVLVSEMGGTLFTIAKDVKLQVEFNPKFVGRYRLIGYQSRLLETRDFDDDTRDAGELGSGHSVTALYELIPPSEVKDDPQGSTQLKYQKSVSKPSNEVATVHLRYKKPSESKSIKLSHTHQSSLDDWHKASQDFRFSAGVTLFGMLLRDSKHLKQQDEHAPNYWSLTHELVSEAQGEDTQGYRAELIALISRAQSLVLKK